MTISQINIKGLVLDYCAPAAKTHAPPLPILFVHGMCGGSWCFENYLRAASDRGWETYALNLRGHYGSRPGSNLGSVSTEDYVEDVDDVLKVIGPAILVGHSMGGLIAQKVASVRGDNVRGAIFVTSAPPKGIPLFRWRGVSRLWKPNYWSTWRGRGTIMPSYTDVRYFALNCFSDADARKFYLRFVEESAKAVHEVAFGHIGVDNGVKCPTLVVGAQKDHILPPDIQRRISKKYGSDYIEFDGMGHMLMLEENWKPSAEQILEWVARL